MRRIKIKILGLGYKRHNQAYIRIYDKRGCLVYQGRTHNNVICPCLKNGCYTIVIITCMGKTKRCLLITPNMDTYYITLRNILYNPNNSARNLTFLLTDYNYSNLPIGKGILDFE